MTAIEVFEPQFTFHGFRYVEIDNYPGELSTADVTARVLHSDTPWTGEFECSDPMVNQLQSNITWGQRGNFVAVPTDCPQRDERLGWLADAQIFAPTASRNADVSAFFARWMRDVVDGQDDDGAFRDVAPVVSMRPRGRPGVGRRRGHHPLAPVAHVRRPARAGAQLRRDGRWVAHIRRHNPDLRWRHRTGNSYGDWLQVDVTTPRDVLATAYFARSTQIVAEAAEVLGRDDEAAEHRALHAAIRAAFIESYVGDDGTVEGGTQTAYLLALAFGLLPQRPGARRRSSISPPTSRSGTTASPPGSSASRCCARCWPTTAGPTSPTPCCTRRTSRRGDTRSGTVPRRSGSAGTAGPTTAGSSPPR